jgi:curved DNA-binding protein CbpA
MSLATIVYEGVRRRFSESLLDDLLQPFLDAYVAPHPDPAHRFQDFSLEADERRLLALVDGRRTLAEVIEKAGMSRMQAKHLVYALLASETIQPLPRQAKKKDALEPPPRPPPLSQVSPVNARPPPLKRRSDVVFAARHGSVEGSPVEDVRARLVDRARGMRKQNFFEMLGVSRQAGADEVQRAYHALVREVHPDKLRGAITADARALAEQIFQQLETAFETLADDARRAEYQRKLEQGQKTGVSDELGKILTAESRFKKGELALHGGAYAKAAALFREAVELYPEEGEFHAHLGWALFLESPDDPVVQADALHRLNQGVQLSPRLDRAHIFLGRVFSRMGRSAEAQKAFEQALVCNPDSAEALAELRLSGVPTRQRR